MGIFGLPHFMDHSSVQKLKRKDFKNEKKSRKYCIRVWTEVQEVQGEVCTTCRLGLFLLVVSWCYQIMVQYYNVSLYLHLSSAILLSIVNV
jgi:hypothetical protein